jgi:pilus assembly protein FimV
VLPSPSQFEAVKANAASVDTGPVDLDLDLDLDLDATTPPHSAPMPLPAAQAPAREPESEGMLRFDSIAELPTVATPRPAEVPAPQSDFAMDFDLSAISLDLEPTVMQPAAAPAAATASAGADVGEIDFAPEVDDGTDPLARKLELAEEFRQIGDMEGARDLLQEVVGKASGALKSKAQGMLDTLA